MVLGSPHLLFGGQCEVSHLSETFESIVADHIHALWSLPCHRAIYIQQGYASPRAVVADIFAGRSLVGEGLLASAGAGPSPERAGSVGSNADLDGESDAEQAYAACPDMPPLEEMLRAGPFRPPAPPLTIPSLNTISYLL